MLSIQTVLGDNKDTLKAQELILDELVSNEGIQAFIKQHKLTKDEVIENALELREYLLYERDLKLGIFRSGNSQLVGKLSMNERRKVRFEYQYSESYEELERLRQFIDCYYMDEQMLKAEFEDFLAEKPSSGLVEISKSVVEIRKGHLPTKGFFISGKNGVGKTHLMLALAKEFYKQSIKSTVVFFPELIRELKYNQYESHKIIKKLQQTPVLMIDDIGSEMQTSFSRDEILLPIINARMNDKKLTYFTSNFDMKSLEHHFSQTQYGEHEPVKAKRVIERIHALSHEVVLTGDNKRR